MHTHKKWKSMLAGAAVAAVLTLPAFGADGWMTIPTHSFPDTHGLTVHDLVGNLTVGVKDGPATIQVTGVQARVNALSFKAVGGELVVEGTGSESVWDWRHWLDFSDTNVSRSDLTVHVTVPRGTSVNVDDLVGDAHIGDTMGPMKFSAVSTNSQIGRVQGAKIELAGSGKVVVADVGGDLSVETAGAGKIQTGNAQDVHADVAGSGSINTGAIQSLHLDIAGSGDFSAAKVNGPTHVDIMGSGSVNIAGGEANPLHVDIAGSGNFVLNGVAVDPHVSTVGSGNVRLKAIRGNLVNDGMANVKIGSE
jgi:hypothetical protein